jgi:hypothetical protein
VPVGFLAAAVTAIFWQWCRWVSSQWHFAIGAESFSGACHESFELREEARHLRIVFLIAVAKEHFTYFGGLTAREGDFHGYTSLCYPVRD